MSDGTPVYGGEAQMPEAVMQQLRVSVRRISVEFADLYRKLRWQWAKTRGIPSVEAIADHIRAELDRIANEWLAIEPDGTARLYTSSGGIVIEVSLEHDGSVECWSACIAFERSHHVFWSPEQDQDTEQAAPTPKRRRRTS
jgi:hypothetical protein